MDCDSIDALRTKEYWDNRYQNVSSEEEFDWFKGYEELAPWLINGLLRPDDRIVVLGCGNSVLAKSNLPNLLMCSRHYHPDFMRRDIRISGMLTFQRL